MGDREEKSQGTEGFVVQKWNNEEDYASGKEPDEVVEQ